MCSTDRLMNVLSLQSEECIISLMHYRVSYTVCVNNFQIISSIRNSTAGFSSKALHGTMRYVRGHFPPLLPQRTVVQNMTTKQDYNVIRSYRYRSNSFNDRMFQNMLLQKTNDYITTIDIILPHCDFKVKSYSNKKMIQHKITYLNQKLRAPLYFLLMNSEYDLFRTQYNIMHPNDNTN